MRRLFFVFMCAFTLLSSCKKNKENEGNTSSKCTISSIYDDYRSKNYELGYDDLGRVNVVTTGLNEDKIEYFRDKIIIKRYEDTELQETLLFPLSNGLITSGANYNYTYDNGYLTSVQYEYSNIEPFTLTYEDGNLVKIKDDSYDDNFTYDETLPYIPFSLLLIRDVEFLIEYYDQVLYQAGYFGKLSKNRVTGINSKPVNYTFDDKGNVSLIKFLYRGDHFETFKERVKSYVYSCK